MKKLLKGIVEFRQTARPDYKEKFAHLALGQSPDALFIACSDSRVVPNLFASTDPGDLFVVRNVGNLIPDCNPKNDSGKDEGIAAAIEFSVTNLQVSDIIVCGHSDCGAMHSLLDGRSNVPSVNLRSWLRHGEPSLNRIDEIREPLSPENRLSQVNVLQQLEHLQSYTVIRERIAKGLLALHAWWFDLKSASVYAYEQTERKYLLIDEEESNRILDRRLNNSV